MKNNSLIKPIIAIASALVYFCSCDMEFPGPERHYDIPFKNNSNSSIYIVWKPLYYNNNQPLDTLIYYSNDPTQDCPNTTHKAEPGEENTRALHSYFDPWEKKFHSTYYGFDTLVVVVYNADTLETYGWKLVCNNYIQKYDLTLEDLQSVNFKLSFPPTKEMKHIHMWPPYGTYDNNGKQKDERR